MPLGELLLPVFELCLRGERVDEPRNAFNPLSAGERRLDALFLRRSEGLPVRAGEDDRPAAATRDAELLAELFLHSFGRGAGDRDLADQGAAEEEERPYRQSEDHHLGADE